MRLRGLLSAAGGESHADGEAKDEQTKVHEGVLKVLTVYQHLIQDRTQVKREAERYEPGAGQVRVGGTRQRLIPTKHLHFRCPRPHRVILML